MSTYPIIAHMGAAEPVLETLSTWEVWTQSWNWDPWSIGLWALAQVIYIKLGGLKNRRKFLIFSSGNLILLLALISPIATLGETYLFSVHMVQHLLLEIVAVPLMLLGLPPRIAAWPMRWHWWRSIAKTLSQPMLAWVIGVTTLWVWHYPLLYNGALESKTVHFFQHLSFIISATIFFNALLDPIEKFRLDGPRAMIYLFSAAALNSLLAIALTFAPEGLYPYYLNPRDPLEILHMIRNDWGMSPALDQQTGGAIMWVMGGLVFFIILLGVMARWYAKNPETTHVTLGGKT